MNLMIKQKPKTYGVYDINSAKVSEETAILFVVAIVQPKDEQRLTPNFKMDDYAGKGESIGGLVKIGYRF